MHSAHRQGRDQLKRASPSAFLDVGFEQPLVTTDSADKTLNNFVKKIDSGAKQTESAWTSTINALGNTWLGGSVSDAVTGLLGKLGLGT